MTSVSAIPNLDALFRAYLAGPPAPTVVASKPGYTGDLLADLLEGRVFAGTEFPEGYRPEPDPTSNVDTGPAILVVTRGPASFSPPLYQPVVEVRSYGLNEAIARRVDLAVLAHLHDATTRVIRRAWQTTNGQIRKEPEPRLWPYVLRTYGAIVAVG